MLGELADHRDVLVPPEGDRLIIDPIYSGDGDEEDHQIEQNCGEFDDHIDDDDAEDRGDDVCVLPQYCVQLELWTEGERESKLGVDVRVPGRQNYSRRTNPESGI